MEEETSGNAPVLGWVSKLREGIASLDSTAAELKTLDSYLSELQIIIATFADKTGQGIVLIQDNKYIWANRAACEIFGYTLEEVMALTPEQITLPDMRDKYLARVKMLMAGDRDDLPTEWPALRKDRTIRFVRAFGYRVTFLLMPALMVFFYDITEDRKIQAELQMRAEILDSVSDAVLLMEPSGKIVYANEASSELTGYTRDELLHISVQKLGAPEFEDRLNIRINQFSEHKEARYKAYSVHKDGTRIPVEIRGKVIRQGGRPFLLGVAREIRQADEPEKGIHPHK
jgi:two-component system, NtrC family, sensor kinase